jgi:single-stranded DNA-binding protein
MSTIVKGNVAAISEIRTLPASGKQVITVTVIDNHRRKVADEYVDDGRTVYEISFTNTITDRIANSFRTGDAVLIEADNLRTSTYTTRGDQLGAVIKAWGIDIGLSVRFKAFGAEG